MRLAFAVATGSPSALLRCLLRAADRRRRCPGVVFVWGDRIFAAGVFLDFRRAARLVRGRHEVRSL